MERSFATTSDFAAIPVDAEPIGKKKTCEFWINRRNTIDSIGIDRHDSSLEIAGTRMTALRTLLGAISAGIKLSVIIKIIYIAETVFFNAKLHVHF